MNRRRNAFVAYAATGLVAVMVVMSYAAVPLYELFCQVTGYGGTTQASGNQAPGAISDREVTVTFDANVNRGLPWRFEPLQRNVRLKVGEHTLIYYRAVNTGDRPVTGVATFNVTPFKVGAYFDKIECFCFTEQTLAPGESIDMPVAFFVDPDIAKNRNLDDVTDIVLSYTFFPADRSAQGRQARSVDGAADRNAL